MLPLKEKDKPIVQKLLSAGCCARCILRFCCTRVQAAYRQPQQETLKELLAFISNTENSKSQDPAASESTGDNKSQDAAVSESTGDNKSQDAAVSESTGDNKSHDAAVSESTGDNKSHDAAVSEAAEDPPSKRAKLEPNETKAGSEEEEEDAAAKSRVCVVCLGILQEFCDITQAVKIAEAVKAEKYEFDSLLLSVSLPAQLCVREHSCWLHVKKEVRDKGLVLDKDDIIPLKEAFKWVVQGLVSKGLGGVAVVTKGGLDVGVEFTHEATDADCHFLASVCPDCFKPAKNKQSVFTRMAVVKALEKISEANFLKHSPCPPTQTSSCCSLQGVQCLHVSLFIAGRYNKFCRSLPQTPWVIDGERRMESSVEELIAASVLSSFRAEGFNFSSSGREDVDVRTLGNGRPFAMELLNPHRTRLSRAEMKQLQETINESSDKIRVRDLQIVSRDAMSRMKEGEEEKTKSYTALVWTRKPIQRDDIIFIGDIKELTLDQKTPLRVLHRRALAVRQRVVHSMNARFLDPHHFHLELKTQAGTYIKEFVHGDFGRTKPNLCELLQTDTDILELDVEGRGVSSIVTLMTHRCFFLSHLRTLDS
ncbi:putative tRNA pseudouridine synthase Pus10 isoform X2 [Hippoglossus stenolepis]|nr:putative tRNA pseudouridine synthase Pus10 isoform X2 [Hippoglossus stenolepis]XP_034998430.1 putative tRNA pseudouridine synthase Pus10 isoform X2 [Hippoglossus stenolepis]XP_034998440.1 putative tRNA pseudouridine synthase Pus10 isoform X2 [Hippoglossus stenolepis]